MAEKLELDTVKNMKPSALLMAIIWLMGSLILIAFGASIAGSGGKVYLILGLVAVAGGSWLLYDKVYKAIIDPKNQKTCNTAFWNTYSCVANPTDSDADTETDITECIALTNAQYKGYAGVWLKSNTQTASSNVDAFYISGDTTTVALTNDTSTPGARLFAKKAVDKEKKEGLAVTGTVSGCPVMRASPGASPS